MDLNVRNAWREATRLARARSKKPSQLNRFHQLDKVYAARAVYFCELAEAIETLGLLNPFERSALSVEATHPVPPSGLGREIDSLRGLRGIGSKHLDLRLSLVSPSMIASITPRDETLAMARHFRRESLVVLDPLYGFVFYQLGDKRFHNHCLAIDFWKSRLQSMPQTMAAAMWEKRSDNMLSGGAFAARLLFKDSVPEEHDDLLRSQVPEICVRSEAHLKEVIGSLTEQASRFPGVKLWFRGQSRDYQVPDRGVLTKIGIAPYSNIIESDLTPSLYRKYDGYLDAFDSYEGFLLELANWVEAAKKIIPVEPSMSSGFARRNPHAISGQGLTSFQRGLVLQQYGAPSAYLDITSNPTVAAWFATHQCKQFPGGRLEYQARAWSSSSDKWTWPTIFVFPLVEGAHPFLELDSILPSSVALRPQRQSCGLLGGAGNLARNYCSRYVGLKLRLDPGFSLSRPMAASYLFPPDSEDNALASLKMAGFGSSGRQYPVTEVVPS